MLSPQRNVVQPLRRNPAFAHHRGPDGIMLSEISPPRKDKDCAIPLFRGLCKHQSHGSGEWTGRARAGRAAGRGWSEGTSFSPRSESGRPKAER